MYCSQADLEAMAKLERGSRCATPPTHTHPPHTHAHSMLPLHRAHSVPPLHHAHSVLPLRHAHSVPPLRHAHSVLPLRHAHSVPPLRHAHSVLPLRHAHSVPPLRHAPPLVMWAYVQVRLGGSRESVCHTHTGCRCPYLTPPFLPSGQALWQP